MRVGVTCVRPGQQKDRMHIVSFPRKQAGAAGRRCLEALTRGSDSMTIMDRVGYERAGEARTRVDDHVAAILRHRSEQLLALELVAVPAVRVPRQASQGGRGGGKGEVVERAAVERVRRIVVARSVLGRVGARVGARGEDSGVKVGPGGGEVAGLGNAAGA